ncbi:MAG: hypothetical protein GXO78_05740 [Calditrichaeota bacterium]|nr:hypothetical protein [Calditrichota bacterium]
MQTNRKIIVILLFALTLLLTGKAQIVGQIKNELVYVERMDPGTIDPITFSSLEARRVVEILFGALYTFDEDRKRIPEFAQDYPELSSDNMSCRVRIKPGLRWSDGKPLTADDVIFTYQAVMNPESDSPHRELFNYVENIQKIDSLTIQVNFIKPVKGPERYLMFFIAPRHLFMSTKVNKMLTYCKKPQVTNGGYVYERSNPTKYILRKNEFYRGRGVPQIENIAMYVHTDTRAHVSNLNSGLYNMVPFVPPSYLAEARNNSRLVVKPYSSNSVQSIVLNCQHPFLKFNEVRQALNLAINRQDLLSSFYGNNGELLSGPFPSMHRGYNPDVKPYPFNPRLAVNILKELGFRDTDGDSVLEKDGQPFRLRFLVPYTQDATLDHLFRSIAEQLKNIGIDVQLKPMIGANFEYNVNMRNFDIVYYDWYMQNQASPYPMFISTEARLGGKNIAMYQNDLVDSLLIQAETQPDLEFQTKIFQELHKILHEEAPWIFLWHLEHHAAYYRYIKGVSIEPFNFFTTIENWFIR